MRATEENNTNRMQILFEQKTKTNDLIKAGMEDQKRVLSIYKKIKKVKPNEKSGEVSLIPAIQSLINRGGKVYAVELRREEKRIDIGNTDMYWKALKTTHEFYVGQ